MRDIRDPVNYFLFSISCLWSLIINEQVSIFALSMLLFKEENIMQAWLAVSGRWYSVGPIIENLVEKERREITWHLPLLVVILCSFLF